VASKSLARRPGGQPGNVSAAKSPSRSWLRRRVLIRPEDRPVLAMARRLGEALESDKPNASQAERLLIGNVVNASILLNLALSEIGDRGPYYDDANTGSRVESPALKACSRFLAELRGSLVALGLERRTKHVESLAEVLGGVDESQSTEDAELVK
jgi:hypothetical protein